MGNRAVILLAAAIVALTGCGPQINVRSDYDPSANFGAYRNYTWVSANPMIITSAQGPVSPLLEGRIMRAVERELNKKGYTYTPNANDADIALAFTVGSREQIRVDSYPTTYRGGWGWAGSRGYYGASYGTETHVRQYTKGALAIDIFDVGSKSPIWHGVAEKNITSRDRKDPEPVINEVVTMVLANFPNVGGGLDY